MLKTVYPNSGIENSEIKPYGESGACMKELGRRYKSNTYLKYAKYENQWVALSSDERKLLGHSPNILRLAKKVTEKGCANPRYIHIPPININFAF